MKLNFYDKLSVLEQEFLPESQELFDKFYIEQMLNFLEAIKYYTPAQLMINILQGGPTMNPEAQLWMQENFYVEISKYGVKRKAYLLGEELIARLSIKQTAEEDPNPRFVYQYFSDKDKAIDWLANYTELVTTRK